MDWTIEQLLSRNPVIPVVTIGDGEDALPLATALLQGGINIIEVALRSPAALDAITRIRQGSPRTIVGAGTIRHPSDLASAMAAGAQFAVSPGVTPSLLDAAARSGLPFLPGAATASEVMVLLGAGFPVILRCIKNTNISQI